MATIVLPNRAPSSLRATCISDVSCVSSPPTHWSIATCETAVFSHLALYVGFGSPAVPEDALPMASGDEPNTTISTANAATPGPALRILAGLMACFIKLYHLSALVQRPEHRTSSTTFCGARGKKSLTCQAVSALVRRNQKASAPGFWDARACHQIVSDRGKLAACAAGRHQPSLRTRSLGCSTSTRSTRLNCQSAGTSHRLSRYTPWRPARTVPGSCGLSAGACSRAGPETRGSAPG